MRFKILWPRVYDEAVVHFKYIESRKLVKDFEDRVLKQLPERSEEHVITKELVHRFIESLYKNHWSAYLLKFRGKHSCKRNRRLENIHLFLKKYF